MTLDHLFIDGLRRAFVPAGGKAAAQILNAAKETQGKEKFTLEGKKAKGQPTVRHASWLHLKGKAWFISSRLPTSAAG